METGVTLNFRDNRMHILRRTIYDLGKPRYIHLRIDEKNRRMFIQACEKDRDAFPVDYDDGDRAERCYIYAKPLLRYLAGVVGVSRASDSLRFSGALLPEEHTVFIDLNRYRKIPYLPAEEAAGNR
jgi:hypothetical protein